MKAQPLVLEKAGGLAVMRSLVIIGGYVAMKKWFDPGPVSFLLLIAAVVILRRIGALGGGSKSRILVWTFIDPARAKRAAKRRRLRLSALVMVVVGIIATVVATPSSRFVSTWFGAILPIGIGMVLIVALWAVLDRPKFRIKAASPGWLRIFPIHPGAFEFLAAEELRLSSLHAAGGRKRLIRHTYLNRFPLRLLVGRHRRNPVLILRLALMKLLRSSLLVRESYHFSETEHRPLDGLAAPLREAAAAWLETHPGWRFFAGEHLPSPAGDLTIESAVIASGDRAHVLRITRAWMEQAPAGADNQYTFATWVSGGLVVRTHDRPFLRLPHRSATDHEASGTPDQILDAHLRNLGAQMTDAAPDDETLHARLLEEKQESDDLLTAGGYQDEAREAG